MPEQRERMEKALHGCAEVGVPETVDLWPEIRERVSTVPQSSTWRFRLSPRTRIGWVFAVLAIFLIATTAAFAAAGALGVLDKLSSDLLPNIQEEELSVPVNQTQTRDGVTVTINRVYADSTYVAVGYTVDGVTDVEDSEIFPPPASVYLLEPGDGRKFNALEGISSVGGDPDAGGSDQQSPVLPEGSQADVMLFATSNPLEAGKDHRFRARVLIEGPAGPMSEDGSFDVEQITKPFVFDFTVPVREVPTIKVEQTVEAGGVPISLTEVINSPARTSAYLCFEPPENTFDLPWVTTPETRDFPGPEPAAVPVYSNRNMVPGTARDGCATYIFDESLYDQPGEHSLTVTELHSSKVETNSFREGPWKFAFKVPEQ